jgi:hypothetical protein
MDFSARSAKGVRVARDDLEQISHDAPPIKQSRLTASMRCWTGMLRAPLHMKVSQYMHRLLLRILDA